MILRKPYAMLIKYFKIIHIVMFVFFGYLVFAFRKIFYFFSDYIKSGTFIYTDDIASKYISPLIFVITIILLIAGIAIFLLMRKKDKPVFFYRILIIYCVVIIISMIYFYSFFSSLENSSYEPLQIVVNRDIMMFIYYINFFYVGFTFIRGFGFDIKKFSFDRDKKELNLEETDNEEYEVNIDLDKETLLMRLRRERRELHYYVKENIVILSIIAFIITVILGFYIYYNFIVERKVYSEKENIVTGKITYRVDNSFLTNKDKYGEIISDKNEYLIVKVNIQNNSGSGTLDKEAFRIIDNKKYYYPIFSLCKSFSDVGTCYNNQVLKANTSNDFFILFKLEKTHSGMYFEILKNRDNYKYNRVSLSLEDVKQQEIKYQLKDTVQVDNVSLQVNEYDVKESASFNYEECTGGKCYTYSKMIIPRLNEVVLILDITNLKDIEDDFIDSYLGIEYDKTNVTGKNIQIINRNEDKLYLSVPKASLTSKSLVLKVNTRNVIHSILLRGEENE